MPEESPSPGSRPRRASIAGRLLARTQRLQGQGGARLTAAVLARHRSTTHAVVPRLLPQRETRVPSPASPDRPAERPTGDASGSHVPPSERSGSPVPSSEGMSEFAAEWLFGEGAVEGIPFAGGAAIPPKRRSERPAFLTPAPSAPATPAAPARTAAPRARPRGRIQEGPVRLSAIPPAPGEDAPSPPPRDPASSLNPAPSSAAAPLADVAPPADVAPAAAAPPAAPTPDATSASEPTLPPPSTADFARSESDAPFAPAAPNPSAAPDPSAAPSPAAHAPRVVVAPKLSRAPALAPSPSAPAVTLRRVARSAPPAATVAPVPPDPHRGLLQRAIERVRPTRREQARASASPPSPARSDAGGALVPPSRAGSARVARAPARPADTPASTPREPPTPQARAPFDRRPEPAGTVPPSSGAAPAAHSSPSRGDPANDRRGLRSEGAPPTSASHPLARTPAPREPGPTLARASRTSHEAASSAPIPDPTSHTPTPPREQRRDSLPPATAARGPAPSAPAGGADAPLSGTSPPGGLRRALARLGAARAPQPPLAHDDHTARPAAGTRPSERSSTGVQSIAPMTVNRLPPDPRPEPGGSISPSSPAPAGVHGPEGETESEAAIAAAVAATPGPVPAPSPSPGRPPVRLRQVAARSPSPQLTRVSSPRRDPHAQSTARTSGERLAGATGAALHREFASGLETIEFPIAAASGAGGSASAGPALARAAARRRAEPRSGVSGARGCRGARRGDAAGRPRGGSRRGRRLGLPRRRLARGRRPLRARDRAPASRPAHRARAHGGSARRPSLVGHC